MGSHSSRAGDRSGRYGTGRVEAFSDGVIAVAITLLVLDLRVPTPGAGATLAHQLGALWPNYLAYVISFLAIGIMWVNHHAMLRRLGSIDDAVVLMNLLLLLCIVALPFTTSLFATYLDRGAGSHLAAVVYAGSFLVTSSVFFALQCLLVLGRPQLLREALAPRQRRAILVRGAVALPVYLLAALVGLLSAYATLGICVVMGAFYFLPRGSADGPSGKDA